MEFLAELRAEGEGERLLAGLAVPYGTVAVDRPERFNPAAFADGLGGAVLRAMHSRGLSMPLAKTGAGLELSDTAAGVEMRAELPPSSLGDDALALVRAGVLDSLSIEFVALREHREGGVRVIDRARLTGIAIVPAGAYAEAKVEAREIDPAGERRRYMGMI